MARGERLVSAWCPTTFTAEVVLEIAGEACPNFSVVADPAVIAERMNDVAQDMLLSIQMESRTSENESWGSELAAAASALATLCARPARVASRLGLDIASIQTMQLTARRVQMAASIYARDAAASGRPGRPGASQAEERWLTDMRSIFDDCFGRRAGIANDGATGQRGGPAPRFIAAAAAQLSTSATAGGADPWKRLTAPKTIARRMIASGPGGQGRMAKN